LCPERGVFGADVLIVAADGLAQAEHFAIKLDPVLHLPLFDVCNDVVYFLETYWVRLSFDGNEAGGEDSSVLIAFGEGVYGVSIGGDRAAFQISRVVFQDCGIAYSFGASLHSLLVGPLDIFHSWSNVRCSVSVGHDAPGCRMVSEQGGCEAEA